MSLEQEITQLVHASNGLTEAVTGKMQAIDQKVTQAEQKLTSFQQNIKNEIPLPPNLFGNSLMRSVESDGRPTGFAAYGCSIQAVHPFTKGFEGPYVETKPAHAVDDVELATKEQPYFYGKYRKGDRHWRGGLGDGWEGLSDGHILKIQSAAKDESKIIRIPVSAYGHFNHLGLRVWVKIVKGELFYGRTAGYHTTYGNHKQNVLNRSITDAASQGWYYLDEVFEIGSEISALKSHGFQFGLPHDQDCEIYIGMPYLYNVMSPKAMLTAAGETSAAPVYHPYQPS
tara:strand:- start:4212 stop:5066 length:855 start_codon:yes stop_codon:yes gene_type:complete